MIQRMKIKISPQLAFALGVLFIGGAWLGAEYVLVKWYPRYRLANEEAALNLLPYRNDRLGIQMQVAACIYGKVRDFPGGVKIYRSGIFTSGPTLMITSEANPGHSDQFSPQLLARWEAWGSVHDIPEYSYDPAPIEGRNAATIRQGQGQGMLLTAHVISPAYIVRADCSTGGSNVSLYLQACEESLRSITVAGPPTKPESPPGILKLVPAGQ
jgi:hypothetical protein